MGIGKCNGISKVVNVITVLSHFIWDTTLVASDIFDNIFINSGNIEKYLTESCSEGPNDKLFLNNLFIQSLTLYEMG